MAVSTRLTPTKNNTFLRIFINMNTRIAKISGLQMLASPNGVGKLN